MTTLALDTPRVYEIGETNALTAAADIFEGAFVFALKADGTAVVGAAAISTHAFAGIAERGVASGGTVRLRESGKVVMPVTGASAASVGAIVYASDDNALTLTASTNVPVGRVARHITGTTCLVEFKASAERDFAVA